MEVKVRAHLLVVTGYYTSRTISVTTVGGRNAYHTVIVMLYKTIPNSTIGFYFPSILNLTHPRY